MELEYKKKYYRGYGKEPTLDRMHLFEKNLFDNNIDFFKIII